MEQRTDSELYLLEAAEGEWKKEDRQGGIGTDFLCDHAERTCFFCLLYSGGHGRIDFRAALFQRLYCGSRADRKA